jgi:hypothetical protein
MRVHHSGNKSRVLSGAMLKYGIESFQANDRPIRISTLLQNEEQHVFSHEEQHSWMTFR